MLFEILVAIWQAVGSELDRNHLEQVKEYKDFTWKVQVIFEEVGSWQDNELRLVNHTERKRQYPCPKLCVQVHKASGIIHLHCP